MYLKNWRIVKAENPKSEEIEFSISLSIGGIGTLKGAEALLDDFRDSVTEAGGQTTFKKEEKQSKSEKED